MTALIVPASTASAITPSAISSQRRIADWEPGSGSTATEGLGLAAARGRSPTGSAAGSAGARNSRDSRGVDDGVVRGLSKNVIGSGLTEEIEAGGSYRVRSTTDGVPTVTGADADAFAGEADAVAVDDPVVAMGLAGTDAVGVGSATVGEVDAGGRAIVASLDGRIASTVVRLAGRADRCACVGPG